MIMGTTGCRQRPLSRFLNGMTLPGLLGFGESGSVRCGRGRSASNGGPFHVGSPVDDKPPCLGQRGAGPRKLLDRRRIIFRITAVEWHRLRRAFPHDAASRQLDVLAIRHIGALIDHELEIVLIIGDEDADEVAGLDDANEVGWQGGFSGIGQVCRLSLYVQMPF